MASSRKKKRLYVVGAAAASLVAFGVLAHTPLATKLGIGGCPWEGKPPSAEKLEDYRQKTAAQMRTTTKAGARPAFGFELDRSTKVDVTRWGAEHELTCNEELGGSAMRCTPQVTANSATANSATAADVEDAFFRFEPNGTLVAVDVMHPGMSASTAAERIKALGATIEKAAGAPTAVRGEATEAHLGGGRSNQFAMEFRFSDYAAEIVASNRADGTNAGAEVTLREQYQSLKASLQNR